MRFEQVEAREVRLRDQAIESNGLRCTHDQPTAVTKRVQDWERERKSSEDHPQSEMGWDRWEGGEFEGKEVETMAYQMLDWEWIRSYSNTVIRRAWSRAWSGKWLISDDDEVKEITVRCLRMRCGKLRLRETNPTKVKKCTVRGGGEKCDGLWAMVST